MNVVPAHRESPCVAKLVQTCSSAIANLIEYAAVVVTGGDHKISPHQTTTRNVSGRIGELRNWQVNLRATGRGLQVKQRPRGRFARIAGSKSSGLGECRGTLLRLYVLRRAICCRPSCPHPPSP